MHVEPEPAALRQLPAGYRELFGQLLEAATADDRIRAMWLSGSLGSGVADRGSDLDVVLAVTDAAFAGFAAGWRDWLEQVTPTVLARELPRRPGSWHSLTPACLRLDVVTERLGAQQSAALTARLLVLDKDDCFARPGGPASAAARPPRGAGPTRRSWLRSSRSSCGSRPSSRRPC